MKRYLVIMGNHHEGYDIPIDWKNNLYNDILEAEKFGMAQTEDYYSIVDLQHQKTIVMMEKTKHCIKLDNGPQTFQEIDEHFSKKRKVKTGNSVLEMERTTVYTRDKPEFKYKIKRLCAGRYEISAKGTDIVLTMWKVKDEFTPTKSFWLLRDKSKRTKINNSMQDHVYYNEAKEYAIARLKELVENKKEKSN